MNEMSRNKQLYYELFNYIRYAKKLTFRDITRKFQSDDKTVLRYYVDFFCSNGILDEVKAHSVLKNQREIMMSAPSCTIRRAAIFFASLPLTSPRSRRPRSRVTMPR